MTALESKSRLIAGNDRFVAGTPAEKQLGELRRRDLSNNGQHPFALVVCCSDSRIPPEIVFDEGLGELFVVRTAGNVLDDIGLGSVEYGAEHLGIPLIVVLGHEKCGAVKATVDTDACGGEAHGCIKSIVEKITPALDKVRGASDVYIACEDENIRQTVRDILANQVIAHLYKEGKVSVIGAKYGIDSGKVMFL